MVMRFSQYWWLVAWTLLAVVSLPRPLHFLRRDASILETPAGLEQVRNRKKDMILDFIILTYCFYFSRVLAGTCAVLFLAARQVHDAEIARRAPPAFPWRLWRSYWIVLISETNTVEVIPTWAILDHAEILFSLNEGDVNISWLVKGASHPTLAVCQGLLVLAVPIF